MRKEKKREDILEDYLLYSYITYHFTQLCHFKKHTRQQPPQKKQVIVFFFNLSESFILNVKLKIPMLHCELLLKIWSFIRFISNLFYK